MVIPPGAGCQGSPPADGSGCGTPASTADNARPAWSTRGRRSRQSRPVASDWFSASTAATSSWSRLRTCPDRVLLRSSGARSASSSQRRTRSLSAASTAGSQRDNQEDEQRPANGGQPLGLGGSWRASSRRRGWGRRRAGTLGRGRGRRRRTGPGRSRRRRGRHAGVGRVPERSVVGRVAESSPSPAPQPLSPRTRTRTSPARNPALPARRPRTDAPGRRSLSLVAGGIRRDSIHKTSASTTTSGSARAGGGTTPGRRHRPFFGQDPSAASPEAGENPVPRRARPPSSGWPARAVDSS